MSTNPSKDRTNLCTYTFADGRRCTMPESPDDMGLCYYHMQRHIDTLKKHAAGEQISRCLDAKINTACDLSAAFTQLFCATAQGFIKPKTAATLTYLGNLMLQTHHLAKAEYLSVFYDPWPELVKDSLASDPLDHPPATSPKPESITPPSSSDANNADPDADDPDPTTPAKIM
jgi:hypothetical protein